MARREEEEASRTCALNRRERAREEMIRFVAGPDDVICPDLAEKLPGRGVWITADRMSLEKAQRTNPFARSLKRKVRLPDDLAGLVERLMVERTMSALALANKAGLVVAGYDKVEHLIEQGQAACLTEARDAAEGGRDKLRRKYVAISEARGVRSFVVEVFGLDELGLALGRQNVVHAGLKAGGATRRYIAEAHRLARFRSGVPDVGPAVEAAADDIPLGSDS